VAKKTGGVGSIGKDMAKLERILAIDPNVSVFGLMKEIGPAYSVARVLLAKVQGAGAGPAKEAKPARARKVKRAAGAAAAAQQPKDAVAGPEVDRE
jgi:hypothetical protein